MRKGDVNVKTDIASWTRNNVFH